MPIQGQVPGMTECYMGLGYNEKNKDYFFLKVKFTLLKGVFFIVKFQLSCFTIIIFPLFIFLFEWNKNPALAFILFYYAVYKVQKFWKYSFSLTVLPTITVFIFMKEIIALNQFCLIKLWKNFSLKSVLNKGACDLCKLVCVCVCVCVCKLLNTTQILSQM